MAKKRDHVNFRGARTPMQLAIERRSVSSEPIIRAADIVPVLLSPKDSQTIESKGYCAKSGQGNVRLIGFAGDDRVWQYNGSVDDIPKVGEYFDLGPRAQVFDRNGHPYRHIFTELGNTGLARGT